MCIRDRLNVLMAMDIISKEKKEIKWCGLPSYADSDLDVASRDVDRARKSVARKRRHVEDLLRQQSALANLRRRNAARGGGPAGRLAGGLGGLHLEASETTNATAGVGGHDGGGKELRPVRKVLRRPAKGVCHMRPPTVRSSGTGDL